MILTLEISGPEAAKLGAASRKVFDEAGGTIGRLPDNSWVLQDPYVSSHHARIRYANGVFYIEDTSRNGTFINSPDNRIERTHPCALKSGDRIFIEPYEIRATVSETPAQRAADPFALDAFSGRPASPRSPQRAAPAPRREPEPSSDILYDPLKALDLDEPHSVLPDAPQAIDLGRSSVVSDHFEPPSAVHEGSGDPFKPPLIPDSYDPLSPNDSGIMPAPPPAPTPSPAPSAARRSRASAVSTPPAAPEAAIARSGRGAAQGDLAAVLAGAGLENVPVTAELARNFGEILRAVVSGVMDVLQARQRIKDEFRMRMTTFRRSDNNPLKFSANVDDALHNLLVKRNPAYLGPVDAFDDAFDDIRNHQMAMLAGLRAAFEATLAEFDPDRLQEDFDRQLKKGGSLLVPAKMRYWELYRDRVHDMVRDADASFRELFGERFAEAYEEQLDRLKAQNKSGKR